MVIDLFADLKESVAQQIHEMDMVRTKVFQLERAQVDIKNKYAKTQNVVE